MKRKRDNRPKFRSKHTYKHAGTIERKGKKYSLWKCKQHSGKHLKTLELG